MSGIQTATNNTVKGAPLNIEGCTIMPQQTTKSIGVILDTKLCFWEHITMATAKGAKWMKALKQMSCGIRHLTPSLPYRTTLEASQHAEAGHTGIYRGNENNGNGCR